MHTLNIGDWKIAVDQDQHWLAAIDIQKIDARQYHITHQGAIYEVVFLHFDAENNTYKIKVNGKPTTVQVEDRFDCMLQKMGLNLHSRNKATVLKAPMPGMIIALNVQNGDSIKKGDPLLTLEAMKMENIIKASSDGIIKNVLVRQGEAVEKNKILIEME